MTQSIFEYAPHDAAPLLTVNGDTLTRQDFFDKVRLFNQQVRASPLHGQKAFVVLDVQDPSDFYPLLFSLWHQDIRVVLPNRDYFDGKRPFAYNAYRAGVEQGKVTVKENPRFMPAELPEAGDTIVFSSGSTGIPKGILHAKEHFFQNATLTANRMGCRDFCSLCFLKPYLVSGLNHFLVHLLTGSHLLFADFHDLEAAAGLARHYPEAGVVGSPMHIVSSLNYLSARSQPRFFFSSGDFISRNAIGKVFEIFPGATFFNVYGLAELAGRFFINEINGQTKPAQFELLGSALDGLIYKTIDERLFVNSKILFYGYIIEGKFTPASLWHDTGDLVGKRGDWLCHCGRSNAEVKVLGNKVNINYLETRIKNILGTDLLVLVAVPHASFGNILTLVLHKSVVEAKKVVSAKLKSGLAAQEMPHKYCVIEDMPFTQTMKIDRISIAKCINSLEILS